MWDSSWGQVGEVRKNVEELSAVFRVAIESLSHTVTALKVLESDGKSKPAQASSAKTTVSQFV